MNNNNKCIYHIFLLIKHEFVIIFRQFVSLYGIGLFILAAALLISLSFYNISSTLWFCLFWLCQLFNCVQVITKNNTITNQVLQAYYSTIVSPQEFVLAKIIINSFLMILFSILSFITLFFFIMVDISVSTTMVITFLLGSLSFGIFFTFIQGLASSINVSQNSLILVVGFPLIIPLFILITNASLNLLNKKTLSSFYILQIIGAYDILLIILALILIPYIWEM